MKSGKTEGGYARKVTGKKKRRKGRRVNRDSVINGAFY